MKNFLKISLWALALCLLFTACKKDNTPKTPKELLTGNSWVIVILEYKDAGDTVWTTNPISGCNADNFYTFGEDGILTADMGAVKCSPGSAQTATTTYELLPDNKTLVIDGEAATIEELTASKMVISGSDGTGYMERTTFKAK